MRSGSGNSLPWRAGFGVLALFLGIGFSLAASPAALTRQARNAPPPNPSPQGQTLPAVLAGMDQAAARFTSMSASLEYTKVTVIVNDHSIEKGEIFFEKARGKTRVLIAFRQPAEKYVLFASGKVSLYRPKIAEVEEYPLSQRQDLVEQFLLLGFGTPGRELEGAYRISLRGESDLDGQRVVHLELVPKSAQVGAQLQRLELWLSPQTWQPIQQKFWEASGDYLVARYRGPKLNVPIPGSRFRLPIRGKVQTIRH